MDVAPLLRNAVFLLIMSTLELLLWVILTAFVLKDKVDFRHGLLVLQPIVTSLLGSLFLSVARRVQARRA
jgi:hypothetical protein